MGNGSLGWFYTGTNNAYIYKCYTYSDDIAENLTHAPQMVFDSIINSYVVDQYPGYFPQKEEIRGAALYWPMDGRISGELDYENFVAKYFGGVVRDVYSFNSDPNQEIYILKEDSFTSGNLHDIQELIDRRRAHGIQVFYHVLALSSGRTLTHAFTVDTLHYSEFLVLGLQDYLDSKCFKFSRETKTFNTVKMASELSSKFGVPFYPADSNTFTLTNIEFVSQILFNLSKV
ncbi:MAG: hypothetical protein HQL13_08820 [Candidatus Omnitrophica bacterium]|nr:hypothetical protein [Candidatus Omnitrophota bacterium]